jgi:hypothetical protein
MSDREPGIRGLGRSLLLGINEPLTLAPASRESFAQVKSMAGCEAAERGRV